MIINYQVYINGMYVGILALGPLSARRYERAGYKLVRLAVNKVAICG